MYSFSLNHMQSLKSFHNIFPPPPGNQRGPTDSYFLHMCGPALPFLLPQLQFQPFYLLSKMLLY